MTKDEIKQRLFETVTQDLHDSYLAEILADLYSRIETTNRNMYQGIGHKVIMEGSESVINPNTYYGVKFKKPTKLNVRELLDEYRFIANLERQKEIIKLIEDNLK